MQDHVLRPRQAFDFGDEVTIGGRDAVSSSSAFVSDRLGSLSYHKPDHPTLNAAAALGPTRANCRWRSVSAWSQPADLRCRRLHATFGRSLFPNPIFFRTDGHKSRYGRRGVTCAAVLLVRLAPPVTVSPRYAGGLLKKRFEGLLGLDESRETMRHSSHVTRVCERPHITRLRTIP